ncbi:hypothetical protein ANCCEY_00756 [Ancylostoma ceylanicum]|uniref:Uncharacterized protein n=1 Tax=Ancylostoma ceylanicum TaxID=53326 RepID=A0A0D6MBB4_9BILA|nr:hypothetical protein ANCCEY_00756 [Ancylostoma ceylanicum]
MVCSVSAFPVATIAAISATNGSNSLEEGMCFSGTNATKLLAETTANRTTSTTFISKDKLCTTTTTTFTSEVRRNASSSVTSEDEENTSSKYVVVLITEEVTNTTCVAKPSRYSTPIPSTTSSYLSSTPLHSTTSVTRDPKTAGLSSPSAETSPPSSKGPTSTPTVTTSSTEAATSSSPFTTSTTRDPTTTSRSFPSSEGSTSTRTITTSSEERSSSTPFTTSTTRGTTTTSSSYPPSGGSTSTRTITTSSEERSSSPPFTTSATRGTTTTSSSYPPSEGSTSTPPVTTSSEEPSSSTPFTTSTTRGPTTTSSSYPPSEGSTSTPPVTTSSTKPANTTVSFTTPSAEPAGSSASYTTPATEISKLTTSSSSKTSTAGATTATALLPTTSTQVPTTTSADLLKDNVHCLFVADLYSYGRNETLYEQRLDKDRNRWQSVGPNSSPRQIVPVTAVYLCGSRRALTPRHWWLSSPARKKSLGKSKGPREKNFIRDVSSLFFQRTDVSTAGIAAYGYVPEIPVNLNTALNKMAVSHREFARNLEMDTELRNDRAHSITLDALCEIKKFVDLKGRANCLVFLSADQMIHSLRKITSKCANLILGHEWERVVAVGFNETDLSNLVESPQGTSVMVPEHYEEKHVQLVVENILAAF